MKVVFSNHANLKVEQRRLSREKIVTAVTHPDFVKPSYGGREERYKRFGKNFLRVVVVSERDALVVVTAHWVAHASKS